MDKKICRIKINKEHHIELCGKEHLDTKEVLQYFILPTASLFSSCYDDMLSLLTQLPKMYDTLRAFTRGALVWYDDSPLSEEMIKRIPEDCELIIKDDYLQFTNVHDMDTHLFLKGVMIGSLKDYTTFSSLMASLYEEMMAAMHKLADFKKVS